jgi:hypothetical protein
MPGARKHAVRCGQQWSGKGLNMKDIIQFVPMIIWTVLLAIPLFRLLRRTGKSLWHMGWLLLPIFGGVIGIYVIAFSSWPRVGLGGEAAAEVFN